MFGINYGQQEIQAAADMAFHQSYDAKYAEWFGNVAPSQMTDEQMAELMKCRELLVAWAEGAYEHVAYTMMAERFDCGNQIKLLPAPHMRHAS